jgi:hypothetical protein
MKPQIGKKVLHLSGRVLSADSVSTHFQAVQAQCAFAIEVYKGLLRVVAAKNGIAAQALLRTLFETIVSAVILAKHPEKLDDFKNHGKLTAHRIARSIPSGSPYAPATKAFLEATRTECDALHKVFKSAGGNWHLLKTSASFDEAEMPENFYDRFYGRASAIAHGDPFAVVQHLDIEGKVLRIGPRPNAWKKWTVTAHGMSTLLTAHDWTGEQDFCAGLGTSDHAGQAGS